MTAPMTVVGTANPEALCKRLLNAETEEEIVKVLSEIGFWQDDSAWQYFGGIEDNWGTIGSQMSEPAAALTEKIVNSVDAVLMAECLKRDIDPMSPSAPHNMSDAANKFLGVPQGLLQNLEAAERSELAQESAWVIATGTKEHVNLLFFDYGEGQSPETMPNTLLSLHRGNKLRIPFVQGKFNMGGTGVIRFCGSNGLQLIITRRHPELAYQSNDRTFEPWSFTIVRKVDPRGQMRNSVVQYLAPAGRLLTFQADELPILPGGPKEQPIPYQKGVGWGTCIKVYNYQLDKGLRSTILFDLYYELNRLLTNLPIPIRLCEARSEFHGKAQYKTLAGIKVRLRDERAELEPGFPADGLLNIEGVGEIGLEIAVFQRGKSSNYLSRDSAILFTVNGQTHAARECSFFVRKNVHLDNLERDLLIIADCSKLSARVMERLFMNSRDRLAAGPERIELETQPEFFLSNHKGLQDLNKVREAEDVKNRIKDQKILTKLVERMVTASPAITRLLTIGDKFATPLLNGEFQAKFEGKRFPTYFELDDKGLERGIKSCPVNRRCAVVFRTDAENEYFGRGDDPGRIWATPEDAKVGRLLWNGRCVLFLRVPAGLQPGALIPIEVQVTDSARHVPFVATLTMKVLPPEKKQRKRKSQRSVSNKTSKKLSLPKIVPVYKDKWSELEFDEYSGVALKTDCIIVNMDNIHFQAEKSRARHPEVLEEQYIDGLVLCSMAMHHDYLERIRRGMINIEEAEIRDRIRDASRGLAAIMLPVIRELGELG